ncbi:alpha-1,6-mannanase [Rhizosphaericola mali]|uniref:Alpha-1,6-mannanase n=2 Tax=Rhizosphaericola mali TaxID=2545455 RepID=A0A5P2GCE4_9BACT|nr:alpha-1,6-mannanase [Rhizosphaericola mali]
MYSDTLSNKSVWSAYDAFNLNFFDNKTHIYKLHNHIPDSANTKDKLGAVWTQAIYWDMAMNAYKKAIKNGDNKRAKKYKLLVDQIYQGVYDHYVHFDWNNQDPQNGWFIYDDIMWWTISFSRAYTLFHDPKYLQLADQSFCRVWHGSYLLKDRGSYDNLNGGMFWNWNNIHPSDNSDNGKMSCINFPTVIAALTLYNIIQTTDIKHQKNDTSGFDKNMNYPRWHSRANYLKEGMEIYKWGVENLFDRNTGKIADSRHGKDVDWTTTMYNQGTFIGASCILYKITNDSDYLNNAIKAANYAMEIMSAPHGIFPFRKGEEEGIYTAIMGQYLHMLVFDCGQKQYLPWVSRTIEAGWKTKNDNNLMSKDYLQKESANISCYDASGIPALMLLFK